MGRGSWNGTLAWSLNMNWIKCWRVWGYFRGGTCLPFSYCFGWNLEIIFIPCITFFKPEMGVVLESLLWPLTWVLVLPQIIQDPRHLINEIIYFYICIEIILEKAHDPLKNSTLNTEIENRNKKSILFSFANEKI